MAANLTQIPPFVEEPMTANLTRIPRDELTRRLRDLLGRERAVQVDFLAHLGEVDRRRAYLDLGYSSLFDFCTRGLGLLGGAAYRRVVCARLLRRFPALGPALRDGRLSLTTAALLKDLLSEANVADLLVRASGLTKEQTEALVALHRPRAPMRESIRPLPPPRIVVLPATAAGPLAAVEAAPAAPITAASPLAAAEAAPSSPMTAASPLAAAEAAPPSPAPAAPAVPPPPASPPLAAPPTPASAAPASPAPPAPTFVALPRRVPDRVLPLDAELRMLRVTVSQAFLDDLAQARAALSHRFPAGRFEDVMREGLRLILKEHAKRRGGVPAGRDGAAGEADARPATDTSPAPPSFVTTAPPPTPAAAPPPAPATTPPPAPAAAPPPAPAAATSPAPAAAPPPAPAADAASPHLLPSQARPPTSSPRPHVPMAVQREVWRRDGGQCTYVAPDGTRCGSRHQLELDHVTPVAYGGEDTAANLRLRCRPHNLHAAAALLGEVFMQRWVGGGRGLPTSAGGSADPTRGGGAPLPLAGVPPGSGAALPLAEVKARPAQAEPTLRLADE